MISLNQWTMNQMNKRQHEQRFVELDKKSADELTFIETAELFNYLTKGFKSKQKV